AAAAARRQARIDSGQDVIVGVNRWASRHRVPLAILAVDESAVRARQVERLRTLRESRDAARVRAALDAVTAGAQGDANLLALAIEAVRHGATVGEVTAAMEGVFGRYRAEVQTVSGVYAQSAGDDPAIAELWECCRACEQREGRRPRILVAKVGQDGHDRGARVIATAFADLGFDVDVGPLFQTPEEVARQAIENDVHIVGVSTLAGAHRTLVPRLLEELRTQGAGD